MLGDVTKFESGAIRDKQDGKADYVDVISWVGLEAYAQWMMTKQGKYGAGNFHKGIPQDSAIKSLIRHLQKHLAIEEYIARGVTPPASTEYDPAQPLQHIFAMIFNCFCYVHEHEINKQKRGE